MSTELPELPSDKHLTLLMAPHHLNLATGELRRDILEFGRDVWSAALAAKEPAVGAVPDAEIAEIYRRSEGGSMSAADCDRVNELLDCEPLYLAAAERAAVPAMNAGQLRQLCEGERAVGFREGYELAKARAAVPAHPPLSNSTERCGNEPPTAGTPSPSAEQRQLLRLYLAAQDVCACAGFHGSISGCDSRVSRLMDVLAEIDGGSQDGAPEWMREYIDSWQAAKAFGAVENAAMSPEALGSNEQKDSAVPASVAPSIREALQELIAAHDALQAAYMDVEGPQSEDDCIAENARFELARRAARAALAAAPLVEPAGWKAMPPELTEDMRRALIEANYGHQEKVSTDGILRSDRIWAALFAAAPPAQQEK